MAQATVTAPEEKTVNSAQSAWSAKDLAFTAMFAALIAVCSWISVNKFLKMTAGELFKI